LSLPISSLPSGCNDCQTTTPALKAHTVHRLAVEDEPNWLELCPKPTDVTAKSDLAVVESDDDTSSDGTPEDDLDGDDF